METPSGAKYKPVFTGLNQEQRHFEQEDLDREAFSQNRFFLWECTCFAEHVDL